MKALLNVAIAAATVALGSNAVAQDAPGSAYTGSVPWQFRDASDRLVRQQTANSVLANRAFGADAAAGWGASGFGGPGGPNTNSNAINNYFNVTNNVTCSSNGGAVGSPVTCTGGTNDVRDVTQTTTDSSADASNNLTGNTITNTTTGNSSVTGGRDVVGSPATGGE